MVNGIRVGIEDDKHFWFSNDYSNALFFVKKGEYAIHYFTSIERENLQSAELHRQMLWYKQYIVLLPMNGWHIVAIDSISKIQKHYDISQEVIRLIGKETVNPLAGYVTEDVIYIFVVGDSHVLKLNMITGVVTIDIGISDFLIGEKITLVPIFGYVIKNIGSKILFSIGDNRICEYNFENNKGKVITVDGVNRLCSCLLIDDDMVWFSTRGVNGIGCINLTTGIKKIFKEYPSEFDVEINGEYEGQSFSQMMNVGRHIILVPARANMVLAFDKEKECFKKIGIICCKREGRVKFSNCYRYENKLTMVPYSYEDFLEINVTHLDFQKVENEYHYGRNEDTLNFLKTVIKQNETIIENNFFSLNELIQGI